MANKKEHTQSIDIVGIFKYLEGTTKFIELFNNYPKSEKKLDSFLSTFLVYNLWKTRTIRLLTH